MESRWREAVEGDGDGTKGGGAGGGAEKGRKKKERQVRVEGEIYRQRLESTRATEREREREMERERERERCGRRRRWKRRRSSNQYRATGAKPSLDFYLPLSTRCSIVFALYLYLAPSLSLSRSLAPSLSPARYRAFLRLPPSVYHPPPFHPSFSFSRPACTPNCHEYDGYMDAIERR